MKKYIIKYKVEIDITEVIDFCVYVISILALIMENVSPSPQKKASKKRVQKTVIEPDNVDLNDYQTVNDNRVGDTEIKLKEGFVINRKSGTLDYISYIEGETDNCITCKKMIVGKRKGAKFCSDYCKNQYHNKN